MSKNTQRGVWVKWRDMGVGTTYQISIEGRVISTVDEPLALVLWDNAQSVEIGVAAMRGAATGPVRTVSATRPHGSEPRRSPSPNDRPTVDAPEDRPRPMPSSPAIETEEPSPTPSAVEPSSPPSEPSNPPSSDESSFDPQPSESEPDIPPSEPSQPPE